MTLALGPVHNKQAFALFASLREISFASLPVRSGSRLVVRSSATKMTAQATVNALLELALMLAVIGAYVLLARRFRSLWHPLAIVLAVGVVGVVVSVLGEWRFGSGASGVPAMLRRSAIGSFGWGVIIAGVVWLVRRVLLRSRQ